MNLIERLRANQKEARDIQSILSNSKANRAICKGAELFFSSDYKDYSVSAYLTRSWEDLYAKESFVFTFSVTFTDHDEDRDSYKDIAISVPADLVENFTIEKFELFKSSFIHERGERILKEIETHEKAIRELKKKIKAKS